MTLIRERRQNQSLWNTARKEVGHTKNAEMPALRTINPVAESANLCADSIRSSLPDVRGVKRIGILSIGGAAMLLLSCAAWRMWSLPKTTPETDSESALLEIIDIPEPSYRVEVYDSTVKIFYQDLKVWDTEEEGTVKIDKVFVTDANNDGKQELLILFWRYGDYFAERDYLEPIRGEDQLSQHINLYSLEPYVDLIWGGSTIREPIVALEECPEDETIYLCAEESSYDKYPETHARIRLLWNGWGLDVTNEPQNAIIQILI